MKYILSLSILVLLCCAAKGQNIATDSSAPVVAYWQKGEKKNFVITRTTQKTKDGKLVANATNTYGATLLVKDSTAEGYTMEWKYRYDVNKDVRLPGLEDLFNDLVVVYKTDDVGSFTELVNYEEMRIFIDKTLKFFIANSKDTSGLGVVMLQLNQILSSKESVEQLLLRDISLYHSPYGVEYTLTKINGETEVANFLGGDPFPAIMSMGLSQKPGQTIAKFYMDMEIDKTKAIGIIKDFVIKIGASVGKEIKDEDLPSFLEIKDHSEFDLILQSGWIKRAYVKRIVKAGEQQKTEILTVELK